LTYFAEKNGGESFKLIYKVALKYAMNL